MNATQLYVRSQNRTREAWEARRQAIAHIRDADRGAGILEILLWMSFVVAAIAIIGPILMQTFRDGADVIETDYDTIAPSGG